MTASGKTTIGKTVAANLDMSFYDSDQVIEERTGVDIDWIFNLEGEDKFRQRECAVINELTQLKGIVLATGGGAVLRRSNRDVLRNRGVVVHLLASIDVIVDRTDTNNRRPLLAKGDPREVLQAMSEARLPLYQEIADVTFESGIQRNRPQLAREIADWYRDRFNHER